MSQENPVNDDETKHVLIIGEAASGKTTLLQLISKSMNASIRHTCILGLFTKSIITSNVQIHEFNFDYQNIAQYHQFLDHFQKKNNQNNQSINMFSRFTKKCTIQTIATYNRSIKKKKTPSISCWILLNKQDMNNVYTSSDIRNLLQIKNAPRNKIVVAECSLKKTDSCNECFESVVWNVCSRCKHVRYCNPQCQKKNWIKHKEFCSLFAFF
eukprot:292109_1